MPSTRTTAAKASKTKEPVKASKTKQPMLRQVDSIFDELHAMRDTLMRRAYEIFDGRGNHHGRDIDDWLEASRELMWSPSIELTEKDGKLTLEAAVPGLEPADLDVQITPEDVLIRSDRTRSEPDGGAKVHTCEFRSGKLFRDIHLPARIDPKSAQAEYHNGLLRITAPIARQKGPRRVKIAG